MRPFKSTGRVLLALGGIAVAGPLTLASLALVVFDQGQTLGTSGSPDLSLASMVGAGGVLAFGSVLAYSVLLLLGRHRDD